MTRSIVIRTRGSAQIGSGHIRRMAIFARYLRGLDYGVVLLCNPGALSVFPPAADQFEQIIEVADEAASLATMAMLETDIAAVFFDDYALDAAHHTPYRAFAPLLVGLDDLASRVVDWDLLVDPNLGRGPEDYAGLIAPHTQCFFGAEYQIIQPVFFDLKARSFARDRWPLQRVFISLGGTDPFNLTGPVLGVAFAALPDCVFDVVCGSMSPHFADLQTDIARLGPRVHLHADAQNVAELMCNADLAIGAGGTMTWERNAMGLPSVVLVIADNQEQVGDAMRNADAAIVIDVRDASCETPLNAALHQLLAEPDTLTRLSQNARKLGGANGAHNIANRLHAAILKQI
jgi:UDP-2,4-diacetamido-2,4,6-trideoxy-beta-L-altropyranose hydrolase